MSAGAAFRCAAVVSLMIPTAALPMKKEHSDHALGTHNPSTGAASHTVTTASLPAGAASMAAGVTISSAVNGELPNVLQPVSMPALDKDGAISKEHPPLATHSASIAGSKSVPADKLAGVVQEPYGKQPLRLPFEMPTLGRPNQSAEVADINVREPPPAQGSYSAKDTHGMGPWPSVARGGAPEWEKSWTVARSRNMTVTARRAWSRHILAHLDETPQERQYRVGARAKFMSTTRRGEVIGLDVSQQDVTDSDGINMLTSEFNEFLRNRRLDPSEIQRQKNTELFTMTLQAVPGAVESLRGSVNSFREGNVAGTLNGVFGLMSTAGALIGAAFPIAGAAIAAVAAIGSFFVDLFSDDSTPPMPETPPRVGDLTTAEFRTIIRSEIAAGLTVDTAHDVLAAFNAVQDGLNGHYNNMNLLAQFYLNDVTTLTAQLDAENRLARGTTCQRFLLARAQLLETVQRIAALMLQQPYASATCDEFNFWGGDAHVIRDGPLGSQAYELLNQLITRYGLVVNQILLVYSQTRALASFTSHPQPGGDPLTQDFTEGLLEATFSQSCGMQEAIDLNQHLQGLRNQLLQHCTMFQSAMAGGLREQVAEESVQLFGFNHARFTMVTNMSSPYGSFWVYGLGYSHSFDNGFERNQQQRRAPPCPLYFGPHRFTEGLFSQGIDANPYLNLPVGVPYATFPFGTRPDIPAQLITQHVDSCNDVGTYPIRAPGGAGAALPEASCFCGFGAGDCFTDACPHSANFNVELYRAADCKTGLLKAEVNRQIQLGNIRSTRQGYRDFLGEAYCTSHYVFPCVRCLYCASSACRGALESLASGAYPPFAPPPPVMPLSPFPPIQPFPPPSSPSPPPPENPAPYWVDELNTKVPFWSRWHPKGPPVISSEAFDYLNEPQAKARLPVGRRSA